MSWGVRIYSFASMFILWAHSTAVQAWVQTAAAKSCPSECWRRIINGTTRSCFWTGVWLMPVCPIHFDVDVLWGLLFILRAPLLWRVCSFKLPVRSWNLLPKISEVYQDPWPMPCMAEIEKCTVVLACSKRSLRLALKTFATDAHGLWEKVTSFAVTCDLWLPDL